MKIKRIILYVLGTSIVLVTIAVVFGVHMINNFMFNEKSNYLTYSLDTTRIEFEWSEQTYGAYYEHHDAIIIPVKIDGLPHKFYFQFDTGAPSSMIYGNTLKTIQDYVPRYELQTEEGDKYLKYFNCELGGTKFECKMIKVLDGFGKEFDISDTTQLIRIGSIGSNIMDNKVNLIDFKNQFIQVYDIRPEWMTTNIPFKPFEFKARRIMLPAVIAGKKLDLFHDSGN